MSRIIVQSSEIEYGWCRKISVEEKIDAMLRR